MTEQEKQVAVLEEKCRALAQETAALARSREQVMALVDRVQSGGVDALALRSSLAARRDLVDKIVIRHDTNYDDVGGQVPRLFPVEAQGHKGRSFLVCFRDGSRRIVYPSATDPSKYTAMGTTHLPVKIEKDSLERRGIRLTQEEIDKRAGQLIVGQWIIGKD